MAEAFFLPYEYVNHLIKPGLHTHAGPVRLDQYLCKTRSNGGNDSAHSFFKNYRWVRNATGESMNNVVGGNAIDLALKAPRQPRRLCEYLEFPTQEQRYYG